MHPSGVMMVTDERGVIDTHHARRCAILARRAEGGWALEDTLSDMALRGIERREALSVAARDGDVETVRQLLEAGDDPSGLDEYDQSRSSRSRARRPWRM